MSAPAKFPAGRPRRSARLHGVARRLGPLATPLAGSRWFPLYAVLRHTGRSSGRAYATPVVAFRTGERFVIPLPFGDATQWARNLFAAGGGELRHAGSEHRIEGPRVVGLEVARADMPGPLAALAGRLGIRDWVVVRRKPE